jgi:hypothetical protein
MYKGTSNYRVCKTQANKCPLKPNTKQAPARTSRQTKKRGQAKHTSVLHLLPLHPPSSFLHSILILLLLCLPGCGSEAADSSSQTPQARALAGGWRLAAGSWRLVALGGRPPPAARSAGGERHGRRVLGEPQCSACGRLISSGPGAAGPRPGCRWSGPKPRRKECQGQFPGTPSSSKMSRSRLMTLVRVKAESRVVVGSRVRVKRGLKVGSGYFLKRWRSDLTGHAASEAAAMVMVMPIRKWSVLEARRVK